MIVDNERYASPDNRASSIQVGGMPLVTVPGTSYPFASYGYDADPTLINRVPATNIEVAVRDSTSGKDSFVPISVVGLHEQMGGADVVAEHRQDHLGSILETLETPRVYLLVPLPPPVFGNPEAWPLRGAQ